jgi:hypothetical protein
MTLPRNDMVRILAISVVQENPAMSPAHRYITLSDDPSSGRSSNHEMCRSVYYERNTAAREWLNRVLDRRRELGIVEDSR